MFPRIAIPAALAARMAERPDIDWQALVAGQIERALRSRPPTREPAPAASSDPEAIELPLADGFTHTVPPADIDGYQRLVPQVNARLELRKMRQWFTSHPDCRKTKRGIMRFIIAWLGRAAGDRYRGGNYEPQSDFDES